jgi:hypothetical protein
VCLVSDDNLATPQPAFDTSQHWKLVIIGKPPADSEACEHDVWIISFWTVTR